MKKGYQEASNYLKIRTSKGFAFNIPNSIVLTTYPDIGIIFFLECSIRFYDGSSFIQLFKTENPISTISLRGKYLAIGQKMLKGQLTTTTIYNLETKQTKTFKYQKTMITSLSLSCNAEYLCSIGSSDIHKQQLLIIDVFQQLQFGFKALIEEQLEIKKKQKIIMCLFSSQNPDLLALVYTNKFTLLTMQQNKITQKVVKSSKVREFSMALFDPKDINCYISSKNGDISEISIKQLSEKRIGPRKRVIISGIKFIRFVQPNRLIIIGIKGFIGLIQLGEMKVLKQVTIKQEITSLTQFKGDLGFIATDKAAIYILDASNLNIKQFYLCHSAKVNQICFLDGYNQVFVTCAGPQIILWKNLSLTPIIKIALPNIQCLSLDILKDGTAIVSGWSDGCIRFFNPKTGKKINQISNAHMAKVTALSSNKASNRLYSGGQGGRIRQWKLQKQRFGIIENIFTGHRTFVHYLKLYQDELYSCSEDGTFAVWSVSKGQNKVMIEAANFLKKIIPIDEYTVYGIGAGPYLIKIAKNDGRILQKIKIGGSYLNDFDVYDVNVNDKQDVSENTNKFFVFGGELHSLMLKYFNSLRTQQYAIQDQQHYAYGEISCVKFSPDSSTVIAATADGSILCYQFNPRGFINQKFPKSQQD